MVGLQIEGGYSAGIEVAENLLGKTKLLHRKLTYKIMKLGLVSAGGWEEAKKPSKYKKIHRLSLKGHVVVL